MNELKSNLRRKIVRDLKNLSPMRIKEDSLSVRRRLASWLRAVQDNRRYSPLKVAVFAARPFEIDLLPLVKLIPEIEWYFPRCIANREMVFHCVKNGSLDLVEGYKGIREPLSSLPSIDPHKLDVIITPGAGFTAVGGRLGFGGGFYDTLFSKGLKAVKVGICLPCQFCEAIPRDEHDFAVDYVVAAGHRSRLADLKMLDE